MSHQIILPKSAQKELDRLPEEAAERIFIVHGAIESIVPTAKRLFAGHLAACAKPCVKVDKTGPLPVQPRLMPESPRREIDWLEVAQRLEDERPRRSLEEGVCCFRSFQAKQRQILSVELEGQTTRMEFDPDVEPEILERIRESAPSHTREPGHAPKFLFVGSQWKNSAPERVGNVLLIEASSLSAASDVCSAALGMSQDECILVEWCCPVHEAEV